MENIAGFEIRAGVRNAAADIWIDTTLRGEIRLFDRVIVLSHEGREIARLSLDLPLPDEADAAGPDIDIEDDGVIDEAIGGYGIEEIIHLVPADPFLGCIIKGAASTAIGQIIRCWRPNRYSPPGELVRQIRSCLRDHWRRMSWTFIYRAGRCTLLGGAR